MKDVQRQTRSYLMALFQQHGFNPRTDLGQNFLIDVNLIEFVVRHADLSRRDVVLEVGTGSGYQAAVLSGLVSRVYSLEILQPLALRAESTLARLGYDNVVCRCGNGYFGWPEKAPFDGILVTAAAPNIPQPLVDQLKPGARMVIPVGLPGLHQELILLEKDQTGNTTTRQVLDVIFVPLTGDPLAKPSG